jgi:hypothetical protein
MVTAVDADGVYRRGVNLITLFGLQIIATRARCSMMPTNLSAIMVFSPLGVAKVAREQYGYASIPILPGPASSLI